MTLSGFTQVSSPLTSELGAENTPIAGNAQEAGANNLAAFDEALSQAWKPHQPISLRPSVVMDLIAQVEGEGSGENAAPAAQMNEQNQQLLDVLLQTPVQNKPVSGLSPVETFSRSSVEPIQLKESSPLIGLLASMGPRLDITPPVVAASESASVGRMLPEGVSPLMPSIINIVTHGHVANSQYDAATPRMENPLTLAKNQPEWSQQLRTVLGERLQLQVENKVQHATIRLDPPEMGKIDISVHMEGGKLQVHINASQGDVYRALQHSSGELRQTLIGQNSAAVDVQISANSQQQQRQPQHQKPHDDILAARHIETQVDMSADDGTLLITV